jgi:hypothetical protein
MHPEDARRDAIEHEKWKKRQALKKAGVRRIYPGDWRAEYDTD